MISSPSIRHYLMPPIIVIPTHHCRSFLESIRSPPHHHLSLSFSLSTQVLLEREMKMYLLCLFVRWLSWPRGVICDYNVHLCTDNGLVPYSPRPLCPGLVIWLCMFPMSWWSQILALTKGTFHCIYEWIYPLSTIFVRRNPCSQIPNNTDNHFPDFMNCGIYVQSHKFVGIWLSIESGQMILLLFGLWRHLNSLCS